MCNQYINKQMRKIVLAVVSLLILASCSESTTKNIKTFTIKGDLKDKSIENLFLYSVVNQHYNYFSLIDTIHIKDGKINYTNDSLMTELYFVSLKGPDTRENLKTGDYVFFTKGLNEVVISKNDKHPFVIDVKNSEIEAQYKEFNITKDSVGQQKLLDSLDQLFYAARDKNDEAEMKRIKESSAPIYDKAYADLHKLEERKGSLFGLYLYYRYKFRNQVINDTATIHSVYNMLNSYDDDAKNSAYYHKISKRLDKMEKVAVGSKAPDFKGLNREDKEVKLSDFKGKYVLVDFWSSNCSWCRKETPNLLKTYNEFKDKGFTILGVSSDRKKELWTKAIDEDKSFWDHIILDNKELKRVSNEYVITGIPHIFLVNPDGIIVAKGLRGNAIYETVAKEISK